MVGRKKIITSIFFFVMTHIAECGEKVKISSFVFADEWLGAKMFSF